MADIMLYFERCVDSMSVLHVNKSMLEPPAHHIPPETVLLIVFQMCIVAFYSTAETRADFLLCSTMRCVIHIKTLSKVMWKHKQIYNALINNNEK